MNRGRPNLEPDVGKMLPTTNADGLPVVPMTEEHKYLFDMKGWICLPGLVEGDQLAEIHEHQMKLVKEPESLPPEERNPVGGPSQALLDHPVIVGILNEIVASQQLATEDCYGFTFERTRTDYREAGYDQFKPHGGSGYFNLIGNSHIYQMLPGKVHSGLTRVVWELNEIKPGDGGTMLASGSHKAAFSRPESLSNRESEIWDTYTCPAGSALIFTEALCHTGTRWTNKNRQRLSLFHLYNAVNSRWGGRSVPKEVIATMPPKRQTLFRAVWVSGGNNIRYNRYYDEDNAAFGDENSETRASDQRIVAN